MDFGRPEYRLIGTDEDPIPDQEPGFLLRGQDFLAARVVRIYAILAREEGLWKLARHAEEQAEKLEKWPTKKRPDMA